MHPWRWLLLVLLLSLIAPLAGRALPSESQSLSDVVAMRWVPRIGRLYVQADGGNTWHEFDHQLRKLSESLDEPDWPRLPVPAESSADGLRQALEVAGPGGRTIRWQVDSGELLLCVAPWENQGTIQWGPGWATVEFRCTQSLGRWLQWQDEAGVQHMSRIEVDPFNPLIQRAHLHGLPAEGKIKLRHRPVERSFPSRAWCEWIDLQILQVDPTGARPTSMLHSSICGLRPAKPQR